MRKKVVLLFMLLVMMASSLVFAYSESDFVGYNIDAVYVNTFVADNISSYPYLIVYNKSIETYVYLTTEPLIFYDGKLAYEDNLIYSVKILKYVNGVYSSSFTFNEIENSGTISSSATILTSNYDVYGTDGITVNFTQSLTEPISLMTALERTKPIQIVSSSLGSIAGGIVSVIALSAALWKGLGVLSALLGQA